MLLLNLPIKIEGKVFQRCHFLQAYSQILQSAVFNLWTTTLNKWFFWSNELTHKLKSAEKCFKEVSLPITGFKYLKPPCALLKSIKLFSSWFYEAYWFSYPNEKLLFVYEKDCLPFDRELLEAFLWVEIRKDPSQGLLTEKASSIMFSLNVNFIHTR